MQLYWGSMGAVLLVSVIYGLSVFLTRARILAPHLWVIAALTLVFVVAFPVALASALDNFAQSGTLATAGMFLAAWIVPIVGFPSAGALGAKLGERNFSAASHRRTLSASAQGGRGAHVAMSISSDRAWIVTGDWDGGSSRFSAAVREEKGWERATPRLVVALSSPARLSLSKAGRSPVNEDTELIEVDSRFLTVTRGDRVWVWSTHAVGRPRKAQEVVRGSGFLYRFPFLATPVPGGRVEWGDWTTMGAGSVGETLSEAQADNVIAAIDAFLDENPPDTSVTFEPGNRTYRQRTAKSPPRAGLVEPSHRAGGAR